MQADMAESGSLQHRRKHPIAKMIPVQPRPDFGDEDPRGEFSPALVECFLFTLQQKGLERFGELTAHVHAASLSVLGGLYLAAFLAEGPADLHKSTMPVDISPL